MAQPRDACRAAAAGLERRIALVIFADPAHFPPTLNAAHVLAGRGWQVDVLGIRWPGQGPGSAELPPGVRVRLHSEFGRGVRYYVRYLRFARWAGRLARRERYRWVYAYDMMAAPVGRAMARAAGGRWAYHNHDLTQLEDLSRFRRWLKARELRAARHADLVVFPQAERARIFAAQAGLGAQPRIVANCPRRDWASGRLAPDPRVAALRQRWPRLVVYQGGIGSDRGIDPLIASLPYWPADTGLVLVGAAFDAAELAALRRRVEAQGLSDRVLWTGPIPYDRLPGVTRQAVLGVSLVRPDPRRPDLNLEHLAGASNKVFEYLACGLPVLVADTPGFRELIEVPGHGRVCTDDSPRALAGQVAAILADPDAWRAMSRRNLQAFQTTYHYEYQFDPVARILEADPAVRTPARVPEVLSGGGRES